MSWNGTNPQGPNWQGNVSGGGSDVGDLYIVPDPPTILTNPSIGLEERNEVPLPTKYKDFDVGNLTASNINGNPDFDASNWWRYPANGNVTATIRAIPIPFVPTRQYDLTGFKNIRATNVYCDVDGLVPNTGQINASVGNIGTVNSSVVNVGLENNTGVVDIDGSSNTAGFNALSVKGGTTLSGGGDIHGVTIGALLDPSGTVDLVRIDVLPIGMSLASATFIAMNAGAAANLAAGGALSLAGGSYIEYNSDQHYFTNTSAGPDFTDLYVGNIHPASGGSQSLNINGDRGVTLSNVKSINLFTDGSRPAWNDLTTYNPDTIVVIGTTYYLCKIANANTDPTIEIPDFVLNDPYPQNTIIYQDTTTIGVYRAKTTIVSATLLPSADTTNWLFLGATRDIRLVWGIHTPVVSTITGDQASILTIGSINSTSNINGIEVGGLGLKGKTGNEGIYNFNYLRLQRQIGSDAAVQFYDGVDLKAEIDYGADGKLLIQTEDGLVINNTGGNTDFSKGNVTNITSIALTSDLKPNWSALLQYTYTQMVFYQGSNYTNVVSDPKVNFQNTPGSIETWVSGGGYEIGNIRYQADIGNLYYCIADHIGVTTEPNLDTTNWEFFFAGSSPSIIWEPSAVIRTGLIGDADSLFSVGGAKFFNRTGEYLNIQTGTGNTPLDAEISSPGLMVISAQEGLAMFSENQGIGIVSATGIVTLLSTDGEVSIVSQNDIAFVSGGLGARLESQAGNVIVQTLTSGDVTINSIGNATITCANDMSISTTGVAKDIDVVATGNLTLQTLSNVCDITLQSAQSTNLTSVDDTYITATGAFGANIGLSATGNITLQTSGATADITMTAADTMTLTSANGISMNTTAAGSTIVIEGYANTSIVSSVANVILNAYEGITAQARQLISFTTLFADIIFNSADKITLDSVNETNIQSSAGGILLDAYAGVTLTSTNDGITLNSNTSDINLFAGSSSAVISNSNLRFDEGGDKITGKGTGLTIENVVAITTPTAGGNITINGYYPPLTIYKNATIGSAISRAANTAEVQVYQQTMTLKANTQYSLNMSYGGLTENAGTATPNNNYYIIYRVHPGTTLTTTNLIAAPQISNNTQIGAGVSTCFMTTTAGTYTGRFYIRNQNTTVALTIANLSATITEIF